METGTMKEGVYVQYLRRDNKVEALKMADRIEECGLEAAFVGGKTLDIPSHVAAYPLHLW